MNWLVCTLNSLVSKSHSTRKKARFLLLCLFLSVLLIPFLIKILSQNSDKPNYLQKEIYLRDKPKLSEDTAKDNNPLLERLASSDRFKFTQCIPRLSNNDSIPANRICSPDMDFRTYNGSHPATALASFPGSGNTWLRLLLEETTGIYTGSIYCDRNLKRAGFLGEGLTSNSVLVTKTHNTNWLTKESKTSEYDSVVFLIRNPYDAIISEAHRQWSAGHRELAETADFHNYKQWSEFVSSKAQRWARMVRVWLRADKPLIVVRYEDLKTDLSTQLERILSFLQTLYSQAQLRCILDTKLTTFKRNDVITEKDKRAHYYYTRELEQSVELAIRSVEPILNKYDIQYD